MGFTSAGRLTEERVADRSVEREVPLPETLVALRPVVLLLGSFVTAPDFRVSVLRRFNVPLLVLPVVTEPERRVVFERTSAADFVEERPVATVASLLPVAVLEAAADLLTLVEPVVLTLAFVLAELRPDVVRAYNFSPSTLRSGLE